MKNAEEAIEKVMAGLRDTAAPEGLEQRVLNSLERSKSARGQSARVGWRPAWMNGKIHPVPAFSPVVLVAWAGVVFLVFVFFGMEHGRHSPARQAEFVPSVKKQEHNAGERRDSLGNAQVDASLRDANVRRSRRGSVRRIDREKEVESIEWSEMHAPSRPAPEEPLTEEERQLLRIVHKRDPMELAALKSSVRDERNAREKAKFQDFFESTNNGGSE